MASEQQRRKQEDYPGDKLKKLFANTNLIGFVKKIEQIVALSRKRDVQPGWWVNQLQLMEKKQEKMSDQAKQRRYSVRDRDCLQKNNAAGCKTLSGNLGFTARGNSLRKPKRGLEATLFFNNLQA